MKKLSRNITGITGTYYAAAELSKRGLIALITMKNTSAIDLLVSSETTFKSLGIQVKTAQSGNKINKTWMMSKKNELQSSISLFYVFVNVYDDDRRPDFFIVPSSVVANFIASNHREWLKGTKKDGGSRKDSDIRMFCDFDEKYKEKWELIEEALAH